MLVKPQNFSKLMVLSTLFISTISFASPVYKATLPDGRVIYTDNVDIAYKQVTDNSQITVLDDLEGKPAQTINTISTTTTSTSMPDSVAELANMNISSTGASEQGDYKLTIQTPESEMAYHRPAQQIEVQVDVTPSLKQDDTLTYSIDGTEIGRSSNTTFSFPSTELNPDKHTLDVTIVNNMGKTIASATSDFYVILTNPLIKKQKEIIAKRAEYDALPWYSKIAKHLKGEKAPIDPKKVDMEHLPSLELETNQPKK